MGQAIGRWIAETTRGVAGVALAAAVLICLAGLFGSLLDSGAVWLWLLFCGGAVFSAAILIRSFRGAGRGSEERAAGILNACLGAPVLVAVPVTVVLGVMMAIPQGRALLSGEVGGVAPYLDGIENPAGLLFLTFLLVWLGGALAALALLLLVCLPVLALRRPAEALEGSSAEGVGARRQALIARLVFVGLSPLALGIALWVFSGEESLSRFPEAAARTLDALGAGAVPAFEDWGFAVGVILVLLGGASAAAGCVLTMLGWARPERRG